MSLAKAIKAVAGIAISGGFAVILSGSAFAASSGASSTSQTVVSPTSQQADGSVVTPQSEAGAKNAAGSHHGARGTSAAQPVTTSGSNASVSTVPVGQDSAAQPVTGEATTPSDSTATAAVAATADETAVNPSITASASETSPNPAEGAAAQSGAAVIASSTQIKPIPSNSVVINSAVLAIQPNITASRPAAYADLAGLVPSAPVSPTDHKQVPVPAQPSGVLDQLSAELAGSVVPPVFFTPALGFTGLSAAVAALLVLTLITAGRVALTFGAYLRRGGYAHAARSDVAGATLSSLFATPFRMGYVLAAVPAHNPLLMVSDMKSAFFPIPNAIRKEDMRCY